MALAATALGSLAERHREAIVEIVKLHKGLTVSVFGSVARGEDGPTSDIDFLVDFERGSSLFDLLRLERRPSRAARLQRRCRVGRSASRSRPRHPARRNSTVSRPDDERLADIVSAAGEIAEIVGRGHPAFNADTALQRALERCLEIIGEAPRLCTRRLASRLLTCRRRMSFDCAIC